MEGRFEDAERYYLKTLELSQYEPMIHHNLGLIYARRTQVERAEEAFKKAIQLDRAYVDAWYNLGVLYAQTGQNDQMILSWEKALSLDPNHSGALIQMSRYYIQQNDIQRSEIYLERLRQLRVPIPPDLTQPR
jgi:tetratricopeptide (TPR) repeat protein